MALHVILGGGGCNIKIPANPYPMYPAVERLNYVSLETADGNQFVFNHGPTRVSASIQWKCVSYEVAKEYEDFLLNKIELGLKPFLILCPEYIDFGNGKGKPIIDAHYNGPSNLEKIIKPSGSNGMFYDLELPYMFVRKEE